MLITLAVFLRTTGRSGWMLYGPMGVMLVVTFTALVQAVISIGKKIFVTGDFVFLTDDLQLAATYSFTREGVTDNGLAILIFDNEKIEVYMATDLIPSRQHLDDDEFIDVAAYSVSELKKMIFDGVIEDSKTIASIMSYEVFLNARGHNMK